MHHILNYFKKPVQFLYKFTWIGGTSYFHPTFHNQHFPGRKTNPRRFWAPAWQIFSFVYTSIQISARWVRCSKRNPQPSGIHSYYYVIYLREFPKRDFLHIILTIQIIIITNFKNFQSLVGFVPPPFPHEPVMLVKFFQFLFNC